MKEVFKNVYFIENNIEYDYCGLYQVSNMGNIKSLNYNGTKKEKLMKGVKNKGGYLQLYLYKNGKRKRFKIHRLVAHLFVDGYFDGAEVDHINTIRDDNRAENLRWCTRKENHNNNLTRINKSEANKGKDFSEEHKQNMSDNHADFNGENNPRSVKVAQYDKKGNLIKIWTHMKQASKELKINYSSICKCCQGKYKSAGGYVWKYYEE